MTSKPAPSATPHLSRARDGLRALSGVALTIAAICALPMIAVLIAALSGGTETLLLVLLVSVGTFSIGVGAAWLVTMTRFPGAKVLEIALVLPLAFPAYVLAYAYTHVLDHPGVVQATLRDVTGWGPRD